MIHHRNIAPLLAALLFWLAHSAHAAPAPADSDIVRQGAAAFFRGDSATLETLASNIEARDPATALTLREMAAAVLSQRQARLERAAALAGGPIPNGHVTLMDRLRQEDPLLQAQRVRHQKRWNAFVTPVNYLSRSLASLLQGNLQVLAGWAVDGLNRLRQGQSRNEWDRKLAALYERYLQQNPGAPDTPAIRRRLEALKARDRRQAAQEWLALSQLHLEAGHAREALFYAREAAELGADAHNAELKASQALSEPIRQRAKAFSVLPEPTAQESPAAREQMQHILAGQSGAFPPPRKQSAFTDPQLAYEQAQAHLAAEKRAYIFLGELPARGQLALAQSGGGIQHRGLASKTISLLFFPDAIIRAIKTAFGAGPSSEEVRDAAAQWLAEQPDGPQARELAQWLAEEAEKRRDYDLAAARYLRAGPEAQHELEALKEKKARDLFARIMQVEDPRQRQDLLERARGELAGTPYARRAIEEAAKLQSRTQIALDKADLAAMPPLRQALRWPAEWFDGATGNMEIASQGALFIPPDFHEVVVAFEQSDGSIQRRRQILDGQALVRVQAILEEYRMAQARLDAAEELSDRRYLPLDLQGGIGSQGLSVYPSLQPYRMPEEEARYYR